LSIQQSGTEGETTSLGLAQISLRHNEDEIRPIDMDEFLVLFDILRQKFRHPFDDFITTGTTEFLVKFTETIGSDHDAAQWTAINIGCVDRLGQESRREKTLLGSFVSESVPAIRIHRRLLARNFSFSLFSRVISDCRAAGSISSLMRPRHRWP
jgi:hypothetical protein